MIEKEPIEDNDNIRQRQHVRPRTASFIKALLPLILWAIVILHFGSFTQLFPLNRMFRQLKCGQRMDTTVLEDDEFRLVEVHRVGVGKTRNKIYQVLDIPDDSEIHALSPVPGGKYIIPSILRKTTHLLDQSRHSTEAYITQSRLSKQAARNPFSLYSPQSPVAEWTTRDILVPNVSDKLAVTTIAKVASNAYIRIPDSEDWYDLGQKWNESHDFGWEENGLRGHVFGNKDNSIIVVAMKGTSPPFVGGDTSANDKHNVYFLQ